MHHGPTTYMKALLSLSYRILIIIHSRSSLRWENRLRLGQLRQRRRHLIVPSRGLHALGTCKYGSTYRACQILSYFPQYQSTNTLAFLIIAHHYVATSRCESLSQTCPYVTFSLPWTDHSSSFHVLSDPINKDLAGQEVEVASAALEASPAEERALSVVVIIHQVWL